LEVVDDPTGGAARPGGLRHLGLRHRRAGQGHLDDKGTVHLVGSQMLADNVERGITANLPPGAASAQAACPNHVPVVIGNAFTCTLTHAGRHTRARVTIIDGDGGYRLTFS
jgi:hypothetical protein